MSLIVLYVVLLQIIVQQGETRPCCGGNGVSLKQDADPLKHKEGPINLKHTDEAQKLVNEAADTITMSVMEGDSVNLHTNLTQIQKEDHILWRLKMNNVDTLLAEVYKRYNINLIYNDTDNGRFKLDSQTGSLTITNISAADSGLYHLEMINSRGTINTRFSVIVSRLSVPVISRNSSNCSSSSETSSISKCGLDRIGFDYTTVIIIAAAIGVLIRVAIVVISAITKQDRRAPDGDGVSAPLVTSI